MTMARLLALLLASAAFGLATILFGWWAVPTMALLLVLIRPTTPPMDLGVAAGLAWAVLLAWRSTTGPLSVVVDRLGLILGQPGWLLELATILFPAGLAWSAATLTGMLPLWRRTGGVS
jgi:hypothetical protein